MKNPFQYEGEINVEGIVEHRYKYKNMSVVVSQSNMDGRNMLYISLAPFGNSCLRDSDVEFCLKHFGMKTDRPVEMFERQSSLTPGLVITYFSQEICA